MADMGIAALQAARSDLVHFYLEVCQTLSALGLGRVREAALHVDRAVAPAIRAFGTPTPDVGVINVLKGVVHHERNELSEAQRHLSQSLDRETLANGWFDLYAEHLSAAADIACVMQGSDAAYGILADAETVAARRRLPRLAALVTVLRMRCACASGNLPYAMNLMQGADIVTYRSTRVPGLALEPQAADIGAARDCAPFESHRQAP